MLIVYIGISLVVTGRDSLLLEFVVFPFTAF